MGKKVTISREQVQQALLRFQRQGRPIRRLPDQATPTRRRVGWRYSAYESGCDAMAGEACPVADTAGRE